MHGRALRAGTARLLCLGCDPRTSPFRCGVGLVGRARRALQAADMRSGAVTGRRRFVHAVIAPLMVMLASGCLRTLSSPQHDWSGFLDDYSRLRLGELGDLPLVYRNASAHWTSYDKVLLEPVTLWRSGRSSLASIPEQDLLRLVGHFERAVRTRLGTGFRIVTEPGPNTLRLRLAITEARASDPVVDVLTATPEDADVAGGTGPIGAERGLHRRGRDRRRDPRCGDRRAFGARHRPPTSGGSPAASANVGGTRPRPRVLGRPDMLSPRDAYGALVNVAPWASDAARPSV